MSGKKLVLQHLENLFGRVLKEYPDAVSVLWSSLFTTG